MLRIGVHLGLGPDRDALTDAAAMLSTHGHTVVELARPGLFRRSAALACDVVLGTSGTPVSWTDAGFQVTVQLSGSPSAIAEVTRLLTGMTEVVAAA